MLTVRIVPLVLAIICFGLSGLFCWDMYVRDSVTGNYSRILYYEDLMEKTPDLNDALQAAIAKLPAAEQAVIYNIFSQSPRKEAVINTVNGHNSGAVSQVEWVEFLKSGNMSVYTSDYYVEPEFIKRNRETERQQVALSLAEHRHHIIIDKYVIIVSLIMGFFLALTFLKMKR